MSEDGVSGNGNSTPPKMVGGITGKGFKPGQSGNIHGPPKWAKEARDALRACLPDAVARLRRIVTEGDDKDANAAAKIIFDFSLHKPRQRVSVSGQLSNPVGDLSTEDVQAIIRATKGEGK